MEWKSECREENSPFSNLGGVETFEEGEEKSTIEIAIPQDPRGIVRDTFSLILLNPTTSTAVVGTNHQCNVNINNDVIPAVVSLDCDDELTVTQSDGVARVTVVREEQMKGRVVVPWKVLPRSFDSVYVNISGLVKFLLNFFFCITYFRAFFFFNKYIFLNIFN